MLPYKSQKCRLTSAYGYRTHPIKGWRHFHGGVDLVGIGSDEIVAVADGKVVRSRIVTDKANATWEWGEYIAVTGNDGVTIYYCHLAKRLVKVGAKVKAGDVIGIQGATGQATGPHLHFECRRGSKQLNAAEYIGIDNQTGTYDGANAAINKLAKIGVIDTPSYWHTHYKDKPYIDTLLIRCADVIKKSGKPCATLDEALAKLVKRGIVDTPEYWQKNADKVKYLTDLICKIGGSV